MSLYPQSNQVSFGAWNGTDSGLQIAFFSINVTVRSLVSQIESSGGDADLIKSRVDKVKELHASAVDILKQITRQAGGLVEAPDSEFYALNPAPAEFGLSPKELHVFQLIGRAFKTAEIANRLNISVKTVETHRAHIKEKLGIGSSPALASAATLWVLSLKTKPEVYGLSLKDPPRGEKLRYYPPAAARAVSREIEDVKMPG